MIARMAQLIESCVEQETNARMTAYMAAMEQDQCVDNGCNLETTDN